MAYLTTTDKRGIKVTSAQAYVILEILEGRRKPENDKQADYIATVKSVYLPWREAPDDYIANNASHIIPMILGSWMVNRNGIPTRPDSKNSWDHAHKLRLWEHGGPSVVARQYIEQWPAARAYASGALGNKTDDK